MNLFQLRHNWSAVLAFLLAGQAAQAIDLTVTDDSSLQNAAQVAAKNMMTFYQGDMEDGIPGKLSGTWWEGGAMFMGLISYWHASGDTQFNDAVNLGMQWQAGENGDYMPSNWSAYLGNDDQVFWGLASITAAEYKYPDVPDKFSWLSLAQAVFNTQIVRWDTQSCGGGLRWQINPYQAGYDTKNAISNGGLFQLAARLARYTGNQTYGDWAEKIWDWSASTPMLDTEKWTIADTTSVGSNCTDHGDYQWTYNYGTYVSGAAFMYNFTDGKVQKWVDGVNGLLTTTYETFFPQQYGGNVMSDITCEPSALCDRNQMCFKGFLSAWLAYTSILVPSTAAQIVPKLQGSANAAAKQCSGSDSSLCGVRWYQATWDGQKGLEEEMSAMSIFVSNIMVNDAKSPVTANTGGSSKSDPGAGSGSSNPSVAKEIKITTGDRAGAGIITALVLAGWIGTMAWMVKGN